MIQSAESYKKVAYDLRTAKQIERRMILDTLMILAENGFPIRDYQYTGFGSVFFVDFILLHRLLGLRRLLTVEQDIAIAKRVRFNKPFDEIKVDMRRAEDVLPDLDRDRQHIVWLDYDFRLNKIAADDAARAAYVIAPGSILMVTVDVKPPDVNQPNGALGGPREWREFYEDQVGRFFDFDWTDEHFAQSALPQTNAKILFKAITSGLTTRQDVSFIPLFNFLYADGHPMLTVGGMIGTEVERRRVAACDFTRTTFIRRAISEAPFEIRPPIVTRKERLVLDHHMPCPDGWTPDEFEMSAEEVLAYRDVYRYFPLYAELLI